MQDRAAHTVWTCAYSPKPHVSGCHYAKISMMWYCMGITVFICETYDCGG